MRYFAVSTLSLLMLTACQPGADGTKDRSAPTDDMAAGEAPVTTGDESHAEPLATSDKPYEARGTEPFWSLEITPEAIVYTPMDGEKLRITDYEARPSVNGWHYSSDALDLQVAFRQCSDGMSDIRYRHEVRLTVDGEQRRGCGGGEVAPGKLSGTGWQFLEINGEPVDIAQEGMDSNYLTFAHGTVSGKIGCNSFGGPYVSADRWMATAEIAATEMACEPAVMEREKLVLDLLRGHANLENGEGGMLVISDGHYQMTLGRAACERCDEADRSERPMLENAWRLTTLNWQRIEDADRYYLTLDEGRFDAANGCNRMSGEYRVEGKKIAFGEATMTKKACPGKGGENEQIFLRAIEKPLLYQVTANGQLFLASRTARFLYDVKK